MCARPRPWDVPKSWRGSNPRDLHVAARFAQLADNRFHRPRHRIGHHHIAASGQRRTQERAGFDAIGDDGVFAAVKLFHTFDHDLRRTRTRDLCAHLVETFGQIHDFGFARRVFNHGRTFGKCRGHHDVLGAGHRDHVGHDAATLQATGASLHVTMIDFDFRAHHLKRLNVLIDRSRADRAATR